MLFSKEKREYYYIFRLYYYNASVSLPRKRRARISPPFYWHVCYCTLLAFCSIFLTETKAEAALADGLEQFLFRLFVTGVVRHAERKETGLSHG